MTYGGGKVLLENVLLDAGKLPVTALRPATVCGPGSRHLRGMRLRRLRDDDVLEGDTRLVRGGELDPDVLRADARRYYDVYATYGISVFAVRSLSLAEMAQQVPLVRFRRMTIITARELAGCGLRLERPGGIRVTTRSALMTLSRV